jgi:hypothetical protein
MKRLTPARAPPGVINSPKIACSSVNKNFSSKDRETIICLLVSQNRLGAINKVNKADNQLIGKEITIGSKIENKLVIFKKVKFG